MFISHNEVMAKLTPERRIRIEAKAKEILEGESSSNNPQIRPTCDKLKNPTTHSTTRL
jgi:hypothetical protein